MAISADQIATLEHILNEKYAKDSLRLFTLCETGSMIRETPQKSH